MYMNHMLGIYLVWYRFISLQHLGNGDNLTTAEQAQKALSRFQRRQMRQRQQQCFPKPRMVDQMTACTPTNSGERQQTQRVVGIVRVC
jgi:hypothetical protein